MPRSIELSAKSRNRPARSTRSNGMRSTLCLRLLLVEAMPVTAFGSDLFCSGRVILLLTDLRSPLRPDSVQLCAAFGLTAAEAKLAGALASALGINAAAAALGVSRETARSQLKAVFAKTNTRRQAELAGLLARLRPSES
jgi:DNA-binding CsgD family transcriptional regulator